MSQIQNGRDPRITRMGAGFCFILAGFLMWRVFAPAPPVRAAASVQVRVAGRAVSLDGDLRALALRLARAYQREPITLVAHDRTFTLGRAKLGAVVDAEHLAALLRDAQDALSPMRRLHGQRQGQRPLELDMPVTLATERALETLLSLKDQLDQAPADARIDTSTGAVRNERVGLRLDVYRTLDTLRDAFEHGTPRIAATVLVTPPTRTHEALANVNAGTLLGYFETRYDVSEKSRDRSFNLHVAADKIDGLVVMPGETFDFNAAVGERSEANGFRMARVIADGEILDGVGGGTCQIAGTLHAAVFFAGLPITMRNPHTRPSSYIKMGLDAVVVYPQLNMKFQNDLPFPVVIGLKVGYGTVRAELRGANSSRMVSFIRRIEQAFPFDERTVQDPALPRGLRILQQRGIPGFKLRRWRIVRDVATNQAVRQRLTDSYPPTTQIWRVGTGPAAPAGFVPPTGDTHPEYTADEFLVMTQGAGVEGTQESKRAGRTGTPGWTEQEHMSQANRPSGAAR